MRTPFSLRRQIQLAIQWYGIDYEFSRDVVDSYEEITGEQERIESIEGIYHATKREFIELINSEGASIKNKLNKGILCSSEDNLSIQQGDITVINNTTYRVTAIEPVLYGEEIVAQSISLEEFVEGVDEA